jgi:hypothetical protein
MAVKKKLVYSNSWESYLILKVKKHLGIDKPKLRAKGT